MTYSSSRSADVRTVGIALAILILSLVAPSRTEASCGDYLKYTHAAPEEKPLQPVFPCGCRGAECSPQPEAPLAPVPIPQPVSDEFNLLLSSFEKSRCRTRFGHPPEFENESIDVPFLLDPPPRMIGLLQPRSEHSLLLSGGTDGFNDSARTRLPAGDGSR